MKYAFMKQHEAQFEVETMCSVLSVSKSGYYAFRQRKTSSRETQKLVLVQTMEEIYRSSRNTYGSPRVYAQLKALGFRCSLSSIERLMKAHGMKSKVSRRYKRTTDSNHSHEISPNRVAQDFSVAAKNRLWLGDITYVRTLEGFLYLSVVLDAYSRKVVGWQMQESMPAKLVTDSLSMAVLRRKPEPGIVFHSDRGSQYASDLYRRTLGAYGMVQSMSRKGNCYDNAMMESFFHTLKSELEPVFQTKDQAKREVFFWMEGFYNRKRLHSSLGYQSPEQFEHQM